ncbi:hypothetical protein N8500_11120 [Candidatus Puniceispirillum sp.]|nr:hypothetical protein [Candidatus Puniceispirillum sp.]
MRIILSILTSIVFFPGVILGQAIGHFGGELLYGFYSSWGLLLPDLLYSVGPDIISGFVGGGLAAWVCSKICKHYHPFAVLLIPAILSITAALGPLLILQQGEEFSVERGGVSLANICGFIAFYYVL